MDKDLGAVSGSRASTKPAGGLGPTGFDPGELLALAEKCEGATTASDELDLAIDCQVRPNEWSPQVRETLNPGCPLAYFDSEELPHYTRSLDAAMTLVPDGCVWTLDGGYTRAMNSAQIGPEPTGGELMQPIATGEGETPALALCAAALKARALAPTLTREGRDA